VVAISSAQLGYLLEGIEMTLARPLRAGATRFGAGARIMRDDIKKSDLGEQKSRDPNPPGVIHSVP
jgi:hypothetical protein